MAPKHRIAHVKATTTIKNIKTDDKYMKSSGVPCYIKPFEARPMTATENKIINSAKEKLLHKVKHSLTNSQRIPKLQIAYQDTAPTQRELDIIKDILAALHSGAYSMEDTYKGSTPFLLQRSSTINIQKCF